MSLSRAQAKLIRKLKSRKRREERNLFLVEGIRLVETLLDSGATPRLVVTADGLEASPAGRGLLARIESAGVPHARAGDSELAELADTETPQGVLAVVERSVRRLAGTEPGPVDAVLVLDRLSDPGNMGTLLRVAQALGVDRVVALPGTVDPWNPKAVRASAGSIFHVPVVQESVADALAWFRRYGHAMLCADPDGERLARGTVRPDRFALVLGNESWGLSEEMRGACERRVALAAPAGVGSLNVAIAGAILLDRLLADPGSPGEDDA